MKKKLSENISKKPRPSKEDPSGQIKKLKAQVEEYMAGWKRAQADYQNLKKRAAEEKMTTIKMANEDLICQLLPILDNFDQAEKSIPAEIADNPWTQGVKFIKQQFDTLLENIGVQEIKCLDQEFDPRRHEAVKDNPEERKSSPNHNQTSRLKVKEVVCRGYMLRDKIIRPAKVKVEAGNFKKINQKGV